MLGNGVICWQNSSVAILKQLHFQPLSSLVFYMVKNYKAFFLWSTTFNIQSCTTLSKMKTFSSHFTVRVDCLLNCIHSNCKLLFLTWDSCTFCHNIFGIDYPAYFCQTKTKWVLKIVSIQCVEINHVRIPTSLNDQFSYSQNCSHVPNVITVKYRFINCQQ